VIGLASEITAAIAEHNDRIEGIIAASTAFLNARQLQIYRAQLRDQLQPLEARRGSK
jgi:hypothetical protein